MLFGSNMQCYVLGEARNNMLTWQAPGYTGARCWSNSYPQLTDSIEQSTPWEVNRISASQEIPSVLWKPNVHYHIPVPILSQRISPGLMSLWMVRNMMRFLRWGVVSTSPKPQAGGPLLVGCPRLLFQYIRSCRPYWRPFLHPQRDDPPCRGDRDPLIIVPTAR